VFKSVKSITDQVGADFVASDYCLCIHKKTATLIVMSIKKQ
jgi:hypothetical protein